MPYNKAPPASLGRWTYILIFAIIYGSLILVNPFIVNLVYLKLSMGETPLIAFYISAGLCYLTTYGTLFVINKYRMSQYDKENVVVHVVNERSKGG